jgi:hypothetical protein
VTKFYILQFFFDITANFIVTLLLVPGDPGWLGSHISVVSVETSRGNNLAARYNNEQSLALIMSLLTEIS